MDDNININRDRWINVWRILHPLRRIQKGVERLTFAPSFPYLCVICIKLIMKWREMSQ